LILNFVQIIILYLLSRLIKLDGKAPREDLLKVAYTKEDDKASVVACSAKILDELMSVVLDHCVKKCTSTWTIHRNFFNDLYSSFLSLILPTMGVHHTHFLMLYVCSTKPALYEAFIERLWTLFQTPSSPLPLRKSAADYLASFLGKAKFVPMK
jgi:RNA polymerase I-specific transcription initiation factor RRN3